VTTLPSGTVTFLFTDIEGSTRLLQEWGDRYAEVLAEHRRVLREAFARHGGVEVDTQGDAFFVAFGRASDALAAAREAQAELSGPIRVRIGVHTGEPLLTDEGYVGIDVHRAARIAAAGHGGQVLVSQSTRDLCGTNGLRDLGEHRLKDLTAPERIYQLGDGEFPPLKTLHQTNLPVQPTPLIGRERELAEVVGLVRTKRLVTLTGAGGSGKTRLALQAAAELVDEFADGVWFVSLAPLTDASLVEPTIASVVGAKEDLGSFVRGKKLLLVLDNLEQLLPQGADAVARVDAAIIATSRERLNVYREQEYQVQTLPLDEAVALFTERARMLKPGFEPDEHVSAIARRLDGLPLALELAAARVKVLTTQQIFERLDHSLDLLTAGARDVPERQRTLRATIEWSFQLLPPNEQEFFAVLGVFSGSFDLAAAEEVAGAGVDVLASLVDKSLLRQTDEGRFFMLETIREFAGESLVSQRDDVARRHAAHYLSVAEHARRRGREGEMRLYLSLLDSERENLRSALAHFQCCREAEKLFRLIDATASYWLVRGHYREGDRWIRVALAESARVEPTLVVKLLVWQSDFARILGDLDRALSSAREGLALARNVGDALLIARSLHELGESFVAVGDAPAGKDAFEEAVRAFRDAGESAAGTMINLGDLALAEGEFEEAASRLEEVRTLLASERDAAARLIADYNFAVALIHLDRREEACRLLKDVLLRTRELGYTEAIAWALLATAAWLVSNGRVVPAARLSGAAERVLDETGTQLGPTERSLHTVVTRSIEDEALDHVRTSGREMTDEQAVDLAVQSLG
jgi:predicted ATPase